MSGPHDDISGRHSGGGGQYEQRPVIVGPPSGPTYASGAGQHMTGLGGQSNFTTSGLGQHSPATGTGLTGEHRPLVGTTGYDKGPAVTHGISVTPAGPGVPVMWPSNTTTARILIGIIFIASLVLLLQSAIDCAYNGNRVLYPQPRTTREGCVGTNVAYALSLATISTILTLLYIIMMRCFPDRRNTHTDAMIRKGIITVLLLLWAVGAFLCTFDGPYFVTGNGYYALWIGCFAAAVAFFRYVLYKSDDGTYGDDGGL